MLRLIRNKSLRGNNIEKQRILQPHGSGVPGGRQRRHADEKDETGDDTRHLSVYAYEVPLPLGRMEKELRRRTTLGRFIDGAMGLQDSAKQRDSAQA